MSGRIEQREYSGIASAMDIKPEQVLSKTLKGIDAARGGGGISSKQRSVLRLVDGTKNVSDLTLKSKSAGVAEADFLAGLSELHDAGLVRVVERASDTPAQDSVSADAENRLLQTLDFTSEVQEEQQQAAVAAQLTAAPVAAAQNESASQPNQANQANQANQVNLANQEERAREARAARLKIEAEIRQKLLVALQPRIEEELRKRLRPKLEEELRPKLIAALRPGLEAEIRTTLTRELTPRVELELKARFAKTLAEQKAADQLAEKEVALITPAPMPAVPAAGADSGFERVLASMNLPVFSVDRSGVCTYMSPAWAQFSGYTAGEAIGKQLTDFFREGNRRAVGAMLVGVCNGTSLRFEQQGALARKSGDPLWVEISAAPLYSASGEPVGVCGAIRDAGESRRVAEQAEADGVRLLLLVDQIDTGVLLENQEGNVQQVNPAFCALLSVANAPYSLEGLPVSEILEQVSQGFIGPEGFLRRIADMRSAGDDVKRESFILADGRVIEQDYLAVTVGEETVGRIWLFREVRRRSARSVGAS
jgi:PAS domain S-box-containing protein